MVIVVSQGQLIQTAVNAALPGDTVLVRSGVFNPDFAGWHGGMPISMQIGPELDLWLLKLCKRDLLDQTNAGSTRMEMGLKACEGDRFVERSGLMAGRQG